MSHYLFTSESVANGHPDKIADQISDSILDACLEQDPFSRVACETLVTSGLVFLAGEITTKAHIDFREIVRETIWKIGYNDTSLGFDFRSCGIISSINKQSPDIAMGIDECAEHNKMLGAGDQGLMFGYACDETPELMPLPIMLAHRIVKELKFLRQSSSLPYLKPDGKSQITIEYNKDHTPLRLHTVVISVQHGADVDQTTIRDDMHKMLFRIMPKGFIDNKTIIYINPTGQFIIGGPFGDSGLTGRKIIVDTYGGMAHHGGGAFSGKDPTKVDRSGSYAARYVAKNIVAAKLAKRCEVQISYAIGRSHPVAIKVDTFGTSQYNEQQLNRIIPEIFDLSPNGIISTLDLRRPIYKKTAFGGHFGTEDPDFNWEKTDKIEALHQAINR